MKKLTGGINYRYLVSLFLSVLLAFLLGAAILAAPLLLAVLKRGTGLPGRLLEIVLVIVILIIVGMNDLLQLVHEAH